MTTFTKTAIRTDADQPATWLNQRERGTLLAIRFVTYCATRFGRAPARMIVRLVAMYYALFDRVAKRASAQWLEQVTGAKPSFGRIYGHVLRFAQVSLDRVFFIRGMTRPFAVTRTGNHYLQQLTKQGRGAILLGAHLGSFEAMRASGYEEHFPLYIVGHFENAKMANAVLQELDPGHAAHLIHIGDDPVKLGLKLRETVEAGGIVALLADRVGLNDKTTTVEFFGRQAAFPTGPFLLASILKCPVYLAFGLYFEPNRYDLYCEPFAENVTLPRGKREEALREVVQRFATRLEAYCRKAPDNWFNFFDFWESQTCR